MENKPRKAEGQKEQRNDEPILFGLTKKQLERSIRVVFAFIVIFLAASLYFGWFPRLNGLLGFYEAEETNAPAGSTVVLEEAFTQSPDTNDTLAELLNETEKPTETPEATELPEEPGRTEVHFIDVGQADCILIRSDGHDMLIDGGNYDDDGIIINYLKDQGVESLDYVIGTHPHEDHIGSLDKVILKFDVRNVILPEKVTTSVNYEDMLDAIEKKKLEITVPKVGDRYPLGNASFTILGPVKDYDSNLNAWSVGIKLVYEDISFVLCGDATTDAEADMIATGLDLSADVFKASHHGSSDANSPAMMKAVDPSYVVISCGRYNDYGHPHWETLDYLNKHKIPFFRTDEQGTIVVTTDGETLEWNRSPSRMLTNGRNSTFED